MATNGDRNMAIDKPFGRTKSAGARLNVTMPPSMPVISRR